jgi:hypothetical protein
MYSSVTKMWNWNRLRDILHDADDAHTKYILDSHTTELSNISGCLAMKVIEHVATTYTTLHNTRLRASKTCTYSESLT